MKKKNILIFSKNNEKYYTLSNIEQLFHVPQVTVRYWLARDWLKSYKGINQYKKNVVYIKEEDWLDFPAFMRKR